MPSFPIAPKRPHEIVQHGQTRYLSEQIHATATDGTLIPISIVYKKGVNRDGSNPALLYGYGAYGATIDATFESNRLSLLDRGFVFAIRNIRDGTDLGREWYESSKMLNKKNSFTDFITCAEHLIKKRFTSPQKLPSLAVPQVGCWLAHV